MESIYTELALYGSKKQCAKTDTVFLPISEVCNCTVSLINKQYLVIPQLFNTKLHIFLEILENFFQSNIVIQQQQFLYSRPEIHANRAIWHKLSLTFGPFLPIPGSLLCSNGRYSRCIELGSNSMKEEKMYEKISEDPEEAKECYTKSVIH